MNAAILRGEIIIRGREEVSTAEVGDNGSVLELLNFVALLQVVPCAKELYVFCV